MRLQDRARLQTHIWQKWKHERRPWRDRGSPNTAGPGARLRLRLEFVFGRTAILAQADDVDPVAALCCEWAGLQQLMRDSVSAASSPQRSEYGCEGSPAVGSQQPRHVLEQEGPRLVVVEYSDDVLEEKTLLLVLQSRLIPEAAEWLTGKTACQQVEGRDVLSCDRGDVPSCRRRSEVRSVRCAGCRPGAAGARVQSSTP